MRTPKVRLYIRVRLSAGHYSYLDPAWNKNRTLRAGYALVEGQPEHHPEGIYYLRFRRGKKRTRLRSRWCISRSTEVIPRPRPPSTAVQFGSQAPRRSKPWRQHLVLRHRKLRQLPTPSGYRVRHRAQQPVTGVHQHGRPGLHADGKRCQFTAGAVVSWGATPLATQFVSGNQLVALVPASDVATGGTSAITRADSGAGRGQ